MVTVTEPLSFQELCDVRIIILKMKHKLETKELDPELDEKFRAVFQAARELAEKEFPNQEYPYNE